MCPHTGHFKSGLEMCRVERMRPRMSSSSSRSPSRASMAGRRATAGAGAPPFPGTRRDARRPRPRLIILGWSPTPSGWRPSSDRRRELSDRGDGLFWIWDFPAGAEPATIGACIFLHRPLRGRHAVHRLFARPACERTEAQQWPWREVHRGLASCADGVSGSVPVREEGAGTRVPGEAAYSRAEGRIGCQRETTPPLNQHFQKHL
jgi:hypothetical protein